MVTTLLFTAVPGIQPRVPGPVRAPPFFHFYLLCHQVTERTRQEPPPVSPLFNFVRPGYSPYTGKKPKNRSSPDPQGIDLLGWFSLDRPGKIGSTQPDNGE